MISAETKSYLVTWLFFIPLVYLFMSVTGLFTSFSLRLPLFSLLSNPAIQVCLVIVSIFGAGFIALVLLPDDEEEDKRQKRANTPT